MFNPATRAIREDIEGLDTCKFYNTSSGCFNPDCEYLHICRHYLLGSCSFGGHCKRNHDLNSEQVRDILGDRSIRRTPNQLKSFFRNLFSAQTSVNHNDRQRDAFDYPCGIYPSQLNPSMSRYPYQHEDTEGLDTCKFYNTNRGCDNPDCEYLHICRHYLFENCSFGRHCKRNHDLNSEQVRDILQKRNIQGSVKHLKSFFKEQFSTQPSANHHNSAVRSNSDECEDSCAICPFNLNRKCCFGGKCRDHHKDLPYQWQYKRKDFEHGWLDVDPKQNSILEDYYCDVNKSICTITIAGHGCLIAYFEQEVGGVFESTQNFHFRRLSTSPVSENNPHPYGTEWKWYWKNDVNKWEEYGNSNKIISNSHLEAAYLDSKDIRIRRSSSELGFEYLFDFNTNLQVNLNSGKRREMRHRPVFISSKEFAEKRLTGGVPKQTSNHEMKMPSNWTSSGSANVHGHYRRVEIFDQTIGKKMSEEGSSVKASFYQSMPSSAIIHTIERIENGELWMKYTSEKENITMKNKSSNELDLFHGTSSQNIEAICRQGFDFRMNGTSTGTKYGKGSYFAKDASLSDRYVSQTSVSRIMFRAKVAVGEYTKGQSSYSRPPAKKDHELYNSCVNDMANPNIFVIFSLYQAYPEYIIHYTLNHLTI